MSQHDMTIEDQSGPAARADINRALGALASNSIGDDPPPVTFSGQWWVDTGTTISTDGPWVRQRNSGNSAWLRRFKADMDFVGALISQTHTAVTTSGNAPAFSVTTALGNTVPLAAGQRFRVEFHAAGTAGSNTLSRDGLTGNLTQYSAAGVKKPAVVTSGMLSDVEFDGTDFVLLNPLPSSSSDVGTVAYFAGTTPPAGYIKANGAALNRTTYATLFAVIGTTYGAGDGATTFNAPDLRGEFIRGLDDGRGVDAGRVLGSAQQDSFQGHFHDAVAPTGGSSGSPNTGGARNSYASTTTDTGRVIGPITDGTNGVPRIGKETRPRNVALLACIKYV